MSYLDKGEIFQADLLDSAGPQAIRQSVRESKICEVNNM
jgi:hypothetical protein